MLMLWAWWTLFAYDLFFLVYFIKPLRSWHYRAIRSTVKGWKVSSSNPIDGEVDDICGAVDLACVLYFKHVLCLQRAFVTTYMLRKHGRAAQIVFGGQSIPYKAHAWVEVNGSAVNERKDVGIYQVWERC